MPCYALVSLNVTEHDWVLLNVPKDTWKCLNKLFWLCQGSHYASSSWIFEKVSNMLQKLNVPEFWICCDIIIITLLLYLMLLLEFLSAQFVHPSTQQLTILSFFNMSLETWITRLEKANKHLINFLTIMTLELSKYLNEQLGAFLKSETTKIKLAKNIENKDF